MSELEAAPEIIQTPDLTACCNPLGTGKYSVLGPMQTCHLQASRGRGPGSWEQDQRVLAAAVRPARLAHSWAEQGWKAK